MRFSIRAKLVAILLIASALPLLVGIISVEYFGYRDFRRNQGRLYHSSAAYLASSLGQHAGAQIDRLADWTLLSALPREVARTPQISAAQAALLEEIWASYSGEAERLRAVQENAVGRRLRAFQGRNPLFKELLVTDTHGYLLAATQKTATFSQAGATWWRRAVALPPGRIWVEGVAYDDNAAMLALTVALPLHDGARRVGVLHAALNVSALFAQLPPGLQETGLRRDVVLHDGRVLARLGQPQFLTVGERATRPVLAALRHEAAPPDGEVQPAGGWLMAAVENDERSREAPEIALAGYAALRLQAPGVDEKALAGLTPMSVMVYNDAATVLEPVHRQMRMQAFAGALLASLFLLAGLFIAQHKLVRPLNLLRSAARGLAATAHLEDEAASRASQEKALALVSLLGQIATRDEIEDLARDFATMSRRVLTYHEQLERELSLKTGEIQRDLQIAREFQEALLPRSYPQVPAEGVQGALSLGFYHIYEPAASVCGDFFDVFKVSEGRAGVFIADVMGHGARSALVTAILRTLLQDLAEHGDDPARLLEEVNHHFFGILHGTGQFLFASAFCMVLDTVAQTASYASAGHPSPIVIDRARGTIAPLLPEGQLDPLHSNAALGVDGASTYTSYCRVLQPGDTFLLYTDGVIEAPDPDKEEFGVERLCASLRGRLDRPIAEVCRGVCDDVNNWMSDLPSPDDICLIGVEIGPPHGHSTARQAVLEQAKN